MPRIQGYLKRDNRPKIKSFNFDTYYSNSPASTYSKVLDWTNTEQNAHFNNNQSRLVFQSSPN